MTLSLRSGMADRVARITQASMAKVFATLRLRGAALSAALAAFTPDEHELFRSFRYTANRVPGSQQSMLTLRSSVYAYYDVMQTFTMNLNLNPSDLTAHTVFQMASPNAEDPVATFSYGHDADGFPDPARRPTAGDRYKIASKNYVAAALYFRTVIEAFISVFLGFDPGESKQARPDWCAQLAETYLLVKHWGPCVRLRSFATLEAASTHLFRSLTPEIPVASLSVFGRVTGYFFKFEVTSRGVLHAHGQVSQPLLKPGMLKAMLSSDGEESKVRAPRRRFRHFYPSYVRHR